MAKEFEFGFKGLDSAAEGVNLTRVDHLIKDLETMQKSNVRIDKLTMSELRTAIKELMELQNSFGSSAPRQIGEALTKLRNIHEQELTEMV